MSKYAFAAAAAVSALIASSAALAGTSAGTAFDVRLVINAGCTISNSGDPAYFGTSSGVSGTESTPPTASKAVTVTCTNGTAYSLHVNSSAFTLTSGSKTPIAYQAALSGSTANLGSTQVTTGFSQTGNGSAQPLTVKFTLPNWNAAAPYDVATYSDNITLSVDY